MTNALSTFRLLLWPSLLTLAISIARLTSEVQGWLTTASGGRGLPLGITWCVFVFGAWFGRRTSVAGAAPRVAKPWSWALLALLATAGTVAYGFRPLVGADRSEATFALVRQAVLAAVLVAVVGGLTMFVVWPRLAGAMLLYGLGARGTVLAITWLSKHQGWDTHYTKFGPPGIERETMAETMLSAGLAQIGFWVPFTVIGGVLAGSLVAKRPQ